MTRRIVVLSGKVASGKSSLAAALNQTYDAELLSTRELLRAIATEEGVALDGGRRSFQEFGTRKDLGTGGRWLVEAMRPILSELPHARIVVVDAIRLSEQLDALREAFGRAVVHVHLTALEPELERRYLDRAGSIDRSANYGDVASDITERQVETLAPLADLTVNTSTTDLQDVLVLCAAKIGALPALDSKLVDVLVGGQYGSEGKGNIAYFLAPEYDALVRVGGPNAGHKVPTTPVVTHRSLPSGALSNPTAKLLIGAGAIISPSVLAQEIAESGVDPARISIDPQAMVISAADVRAERALRRAIGSTGQGVGAALSRKILGRATGKTKLAKDVPALRPFIHEPIVEALERCFAEGQRVMLEGTQGTGLSLHHGQYPFVTSRETSAAGCIAEAGIGIGRVRKIVMVVRSFPIRVQGPSGPMGKEVDWALVAKRSGMQRSDLEASEKSSVQHKLRRVAEFDWKALRSAAELNTPTDVALTFADYIEASNASAFRYDQLGVGTREFIEEIEAVASAPVSLVSGRFTDRSIIDRRSWRGHVR